MVNPKSLIEKARKWQKVATLGRKNSSPRSSACSDCEATSTSVADKGHFIAYTSDGNRFMIPLVYLSSNIFIELFKMSEDEFGLPSNGPITLPCDAVFMQCILSMLRRGESEDAERVLSDSICYRRHSTCSLLALGSNQQLLACM